MKYINAFSPRLLPQPLTTKSALVSGFGITVPLCTQLPYPPVPFFDLHTVPRGAATELSFLEPPVLSW